MSGRRGGAGGMQYARARTNAANVQPNAPYNSLLSLLVSAIDWLCPFRWLCASMWPAVSTTKSYAVTPAQRDRTTRASIVNCCLQQTSCSWQARMQYATRT